MKNKLFIAVLIISLSCSSCATVLGGHITECQRTKPAKGQPARAIRPVAFIADVLLWLPGLGIDFITHAIYKPCKSTESK